MRKHLQLPPGLADAIFSKPQGQVCSRLKQGEPRQQQKLPQRGNRACALPRRKD